MVQNWQYPLHFIQYHNLKAIHCITLQKTYIVSHVIVIQDYKLTRLTCLTDLWLNVFLQTCIPSNLQNLCCRYLPLSIESRRVWWCGYARLPLGWRPVGEPHTEHPQ